MRPVSRLLLVTLTVSVLAVLHAPAGIASGNTLYVKKSGSDWETQCTATDPCLTINNAVSLADPGDTIQVGPGTFSEKIPNGTSGVKIDKNLTITGSSWLATRVTQGYPGPYCCSVFAILPGAAVTLTGMTISGGNGSTAGGIYNVGSLTLKGVWISDNHQAGTAGGAGILNGGSLATTNVGVDHNYGQAGLTNFGKALLIDSRIAGTHREGFLSGDGVDNAGTLIVYRGLFAGNQGSGVAAWNPKGPDAPGCPTTSLANVTISGNSDGGVEARCGEMRLVHVTIAANTAKDGAGGLQVDSDSDVLLGNSIVATNSDPQCQGWPDAVFSIVRDGSCGGWGIDPKLVGALAPRPNVYLWEKLFHIGATEVHALLPGSPAIDAAADEFCTDIFGNWLPDQLGTQRPIDGDGDGVARCDMGAFEYQPPGPAGSDTR